MDPIVLIIVVLLVLALVGGLPRWPYSGGWGYGPAYVLATVLIVLLVLMLVGRVHIPLAR